MTNNSKRLLYSDYTVKNYDKIKIYIKINFDDGRQTKQIQIKSYEMLNFEIYIPIFLVLNISIIYRET